MTRRRTPWAWPDPRRSSSRSSSRTRAEEKKHPPGGGEAPPPALGSRPRRGSLARPQAQHRSPPGVGLSPPPHSPPRDSHPSLPPSDQHPDPPPLCSALERGPACCEPPFSAAPDLTRGSARVNPASSKRLLSILPPQGQKDTRRRPASPQKPPSTPSQPLQKRILLRPTLHHPE